MESAIVHTSSGVIVLLETLKAVKKTPKWIQAQQEIATGEKIRYKKDPAQNNLNGSRLVPNGKGLQMKSNSYKPVRARLID